MRIHNEQYTVRTFGKLQQEINEMIIAIKIYHGNNQWEDPKILQEAKERVSPPAYDNVIGLLKKINAELDLYRENPIKYKNQTTIL